MKRKEEEKIQVSGQLAAGGKSSLKSRHLLKGAHNNDRHSHARVSVHQHPSGRKQRRNKKILVLLR